MYTHEIHGPDRDAIPKVRSPAKEANSSGFLFAGAIPYRDIFMTDILAAVDLVATLLASCKPRGKKSRLGWMLRKQEPAGNDYL